MKKRLKATCLTCDADNKQCRKCSECGEPVCRDCWRWHMQQHCIATDILRGVDV